MFRSTRISAGVAAVPVAVVHPPDPVGVWYWKVH